MDDPYPAQTVIDVTPADRARLPHLIVPRTEDEVLELDRHFGRKAPLEVDVGSGKGRFVAARAAGFPAHNFLAIERQLRRVRKVQSKINTGKLENVRILRAEAAHVIAQMIPDGAIHTCYIFFPDPWPKRRHMKRRLFSREFQTSLWQKLATNGRLNFATDHMEYFAHVEARLRADRRFERTQAFVTAEHERSEFEELFLSQGAEIGRCSFLKVSEPVPSESDRTYRLQ